MLSLDNSSDDDSGNGGHSPMAVAPSVNGR